MSKKFWSDYSIKQQPADKPKPAALVSKLRAGRVDVSQMTKPQLDSHMAGEAKLLSNIREASGLPAVRPLQSEYDQVDSKPIAPVVADTAVPVDATRVARVPKKKP